MNKRQFLSLDVGQHVWHRGASQWVRQWHVVNKTTKYGPFGAAERVMKMRARIGLNDVYVDVPESDDEFIDRCFRT